MAVPKFIMKIAAKRAGRKFAKAAKKAVQQSSNPMDKEPGRTNTDGIFGLSNVQRSDLYKMIPEDADGLLKMVQSEKGKDVVKERFGYTQMPDGNPITRKCSYNSKRKK